MNVDERCFPENKVPFSSVIRSIIQFNHELTKTFYYIPERIYKM